MSDNYPTVHQDYTLRRPVAQEVLPVPITYWNKLQERIAETRESTAGLEASGWAALGASCSFVIMAISLPFGVAWSNICGQIERINWGAVIAETGAIGLALLLLGVGLLALHWAHVKRNLQSKLGGWLVEDMKDFQKRHKSPDLGRSA